MNKLSSQDRAALIRLASSLPKGSEERKAILAGLSQTAALKAEEPYQKVEGHPYGSGKVDVIKGVRTERELRALSKLLDDAYGKPLTHEIINKMKHFGIGPVGMEALTSGGGGYMLYLTDAKGEEYDAFNDLGIGA